MNMLLKGVLLCALLFCWTSTSFADEVRLKSGQVVTGRILEDSESTVKIEVEGSDVSLTYFKDEVESVGRSADQAESALAPSSAAKVSGGENWWKYVDADNGKEQETTMRVSSLGTEDVTVLGRSFAGCSKESQVKEVRPGDGTREINDCTVWLCPGIGKVKEECRQSNYDANGNLEDSSELSRQLRSAHVDGKDVGGTT
jgi:hypothetical protein